MLAYMNRESMIKTLETGYTWFYSRSRQTLWNKGATSGHVQKVVRIAADCDDDTLLVQVVQTGPACHTGSLAASSSRFSEQRHAAFPRGEAARFSEIPAQARRV